MTGTGERRRRYRAIDKPLRASPPAKMNHAVICERITLNRRYIRARNIVTTITISLRAGNTTSFLRM